MALETSTKTSTFSTVSPISNLVNLYNDIIEHEHFICKIEVNFELSNEIKSQKSKKNLSILFFKANFDFYVFFIN